jgi:hypothetical protein
MTSPALHSPTAPSLRQATVSRRACLAGAVLFGLALAGAVTAALTPDSTPKDWPAKADRHRVIIRREAKNDAERRLIATAEAAQPPTADVRKAAGEATLPNTGKLWWYKEELGLRIPYAITSDAVAYYTELVKKYGKAAFNRYSEPSSRIEYDAAVAFHTTFTHEKKSFTDVHVVTLKLRFNQTFCATGTEGLEFTKERTVVINAAGKVVHIIGDGPTETPIMAM